MFPDANHMTNTTAIQPTEIKRLEAEGLSITWSDGRVDMLANSKLRLNCPCAVCLAARGDTSHERPIGSGKPRSALNVIQSSVEEETRLVKIWSLGNYALGMQWADGHNTGIYRFTYLRELAEETAVS